MYVDIGKFPVHQCSVCMQVFITRLWRMNVIYLSNKFWVFFSAGQGGGGKDGGTVWRGVRFGWRRGGVLYLGFIGNIVISYKLLLDGMSLDGGVYSEYIYIYIFHL